jgi:formate dehydrogenase maturation protein FdhE
MSRPGYTSEHLRHDSALATTAPQCCPACKSQSIASMAKSPDANSYWRCLGCGEMWCPARRRPQPAQQWYR